MILQCGALYAAVPYRDRSRSPTRIDMLYSLHELAYDSASPFRIGAQMARTFWTSPFNPAADTAIGRTAFASAELFESVTRRYGKPDWGLETIDIDGKPVRTTEQVDLVLALVPPGPVRAQHRRPEAGGQADRGPGGPDRRAPVGPLRHPAARHGRGLPSGPRRLCHRLVQRPSGADAGGPVRLLRLYRPRPRHAGRRSARAPMSSASASPARRSWPPAP